MFLLSKSESSRSLSSLVSLASSGIRLPGKLSFPTIWDVKPLRGPDRNHLRKPGEGVCGLYVAAWLLRAYVRTETAGARWCPKKHRDSKSIKFDFAAQDKIVAFALWCVMHGPLIHGLTSWCAAAEMWLPHQLLLALQANTDLLLTIQASS